MCVDKFIQKYLAEMFLDILIWEIEKLKNVK